MADWAPSHSGLGKSFLSFNAEFITHARPSEVLDPNSCVYAAAQVFEYLRNMAVEDDRSSCLEPIIPDEGVCGMCMDVHVCVFACIWCVCVCACVRACVCV